MSYRTVSIDVDIDEFRTDTLIDELGDRTLSDAQIKNIRDISGVIEAPRYSHIDPPYSEVCINDNRMFKIENLIDEMKIKTFIKHIHYITIDELEAFVKGKPELEL